MGKNLKSIAMRFRREVAVYRHVLKHPQTPWPAKALLGAAVLYTLSPIDIIPDFVPLIGHLDDLILVPILVYFGLKLIPVQVMEDCRRSVSGKDQEGLN